MYGAILAALDSQHILGARCPPNPHFVPYLVVRRPRSVFNRNNTGYVMVIALASQTAPNTHKGTTRPWLLSTAPFCRSNTSLNTPPSSGVIIKSIECLANLLLCFGYQGLVLISLKELPLRGQLIQSVDLKDQHHDHHERFYTCIYVQEQESRRYHQQTTHLFYN